MVNCLYCRKEFEQKRSTAKFCSDKCRAAHHRRHPENTVTKVQMQVLYNEMLDMMAKIKEMPPQTQYNGPKLPDNFKGDEPLSINRSKQEETQTGQLPTYMSLINGMAKVVFADEKDEYAQKILAATHLSQKQIDALLAHLRTKS